MKFAHIVHREICSVGDKPKTKRAVIAVGLATLSVCNFGCGFLTLNNTRDDRRARHEIEILHLKKNIESLREKNLILQTKLKRVELLEDQRVAVVEPGSQVAPATIRKTSSLKESSRIPERETVDWFLYRSLLRSLKLKSWKQSQKTIQILAKSFPHSDRLPEGHFQMALYFYRAGFPKESRSYFDKVLQEKARPQLHAGARLMKGVLLKKDRPEQAALDFQWVVENYKGTTEAERAQKELDQIYYKQAAAETREEATKW